MANLFRILVGADYGCIEVSIETHGEIDVQDERSTIHDRIKPPHLTVNYFQESETCLPGSWRENQR